MKTGLMRADRKSCILFLTKGKLYAANGYWVDARWEIPPDAEKQSAQVLRLDSTNGTWQIDLEMGKANGLGLRYMKGNILKSVTFTRDRFGKLPKRGRTFSLASKFKRWKSRGYVDEMTGKSDVKKMALMWAR